MTHLTYSACSKIWRFSRKAKYARLRTSRGRRMRLRESFSQRPSVRPRVKGFAVGFALDLAARRGAGACARLLTPARASLRDAVGGGYFASQPSLRTLRVLRRISAPYQTNLQAGGGEARFEGASPPMSKSHRPRQTVLRQDVRPRTTRIIPKSPRPPLLRFVAKILSILLILSKKTRVDS